MIGRPPYEGSISYRRLPQTTLYVCMYICMYVCMYVYMYMYIYIYIHIYVCIYTYLIPSPSSDDFSAPVSLRAAPFPSTSAPQHPDPCFYFCVFDFFLNDCVYLYIYIYVYVYIFYFLMFLISS